MYLHEQSMAHVSIEVDTFPAAIDVLNYLFELERSIPFALSISVGG